LSIWVVIKEGVIMLKNKGMVSKVIIFVGSLTCALGLSSQAFAQSSVSNIFQVRLRATSYSCAMVAGKLKSGRIEKGTGRFIPYSEDIKALKAKIKLAKPAKKPALKKKLALLVAKAASGDRVCKTSSGKGPTPTPTPGTTPKPTAGPTPKPTATPATGNFDSKGNVTAAGKAKFGIPSNLSANVGAGQTVNSAHCMGCHTERANRTYGYMRPLLGSNIMPTVKISDGDLANLTAYINRAQTP
jgi:hypothetical protein